MILKPVLMMLENVPTYAPDSSTSLNVLPARVKIDEITYTHRPNGDVLVTDGTDWHLDITHL